MWHIVSKSGLRGIETYYSESDAWNAADIRNELANQGWHPVRVAYAALFLSARLRLWRAEFGVINLLQNFKM